MLTLEKARAIAEKHVQRHPKYGKDIVILDEWMVEKPYGWIFPYQVRKWVETRRTSDGLIWNGPILIDKNTSSTVQFGSFKSLEYWCELYENGKTRVDEEGVVHLLFREDLQQRVAERGSPNQT